MDWLQSFDTGVFRFVNLTLSNPVFDRVMPFFSSTPFFVPLVLTALFLLAWKGGVRGRICVLMLVLGVMLGDGVISSSIKDGVGRLRPFNVIPDAHVLVGRSASKSMPSSHALNWFSATTILFIYYRRSIRFMLPLALIVSFSRVYCGVHYPSDVCAGAIIGFGSGAGIVWILNAGWQWSGRRWFPQWLRKLPSFISPEIVRDPAVANKSDELPQRDAQWLRLGYILIILTLFVRWGYLASGKIELSEDEAYQWLWSKHLALSYYSKPPLIAYTQFLGTSIWGDNAFGVRFFSPLIAAVLAILLLRFLMKEVNIRVGFALVLMTVAVPLLSVGATLMTIDPLSVLFWTAAMISGWWAVKTDSTKHWLWCGLWMGLGFLSKYTSLFQLLSWAVFFALWKPARVQLRRPGLYLALLVNAVCAIPVLIWNSQNGWITVKHLENRAGLEQVWKPTIKFLQDFVVSEAGLLNPIFFVAMIWAAIVFWRRYRQNPLLIYFFSMGAPLFLVYFAYTLRSRVQPNWIAPSVLPLLCLAAVYWEQRWREGVQAVSRWLIAGVALGPVAVVLLHETNLIRKIVNRGLPVEKDPLTRVRGWKATAEVVEAQREKFSQEGKPVFVIGSHYGITGLLSFYLPEARRVVQTQPIVYYESTDKPANQFYFWPGYATRKGENALYVREVKKNDVPEPLPERLRGEFESITDLGKFEVQYRDRVTHIVQLFACRNLR